jgi:glycine betaine transporter
MVLAVILLLFLFVLGPTVFILNSLTEALGGYLANLALGAGVVRLRSS